MPIELKVGEKYCTESSENHPTGLKWDFFAFEVVRIDEFPLSILVEDDDEGQVAIIRMFMAVDLGMSGYDDAELPAEVSQEDQLLVIIRKGEGEWYATWWPEEMAITPFVERTAEDWVQVKRDYVAKFKNQFGKKEGE